MNKKKTTTEKKFRPPVGSLFISQALFRVTLDYYTIFVYSKMRRKLL